MQLMAERGLEFETTEGLGWIAGEVRAIEPKDKSLKIPHMGWNTLDTSCNARAARRISRRARTACTPTSCTRSISPRRIGASCVAETDYGGPVTAIVAKDNIAGTQFHPEKSQVLGLRLIGNFLKWCV